jgi:murein endopeptidase
VRARATIACAALLATVTVVLVSGRGGGTNASGSGETTTVGAPVAAPAHAPLRPSRAIGKPYAGRLVGGIQLPVEGADFFTWDPILKRSPNRGWRRWGTDRLLATIATVLTEYRALHPGAPRVGIGDLSRPHGGDFGRRFGPPGHASHQNGLDVDVYYPRKDGLERRAFTPRQVDHGLAQDLVDLFVDAGAQFVFVGPHVGLRGPKRIVQPLRLHDDHLHVRISRNAVRAHA